MTPKAPHLRRFLSFAALFLILGTLESGYGQRVQTTTSIRVQVLGNAGRVRTSNSFVDQPVFVRATVRARGLQADPVGILRFRVGRRSVARRAISFNSPGVFGIRSAEVDLSRNLRVGTHRLSARFVGRQQFEGSESRARTHRVTIAGSRVTLETDAMSDSGDRSALQFGSRLQITAKVEPSPNFIRGIVEEGMVRYFIDQRAAGDLPVGESLVVDSLAAGQHRVSATYLGTRNYRLARSASHPVLVTFAENPFRAETRIQPGVAGPVLFSRRPSAVSTFDRSDRNVMWAVAFERQAVANGPAEIEMQIWDYTFPAVPSFSQTILVSSSAVGVGFPDVAALADGDPSDASLVVVWQEPGVQGLDIFARIFRRNFSTNIVAEGPAFRINSATGGDQRLPRVAPTFAGGFIVVWQSPVIEGSGSVVFQRRFDRSGTPLEDESIVHPSLAGNQTLPDVALLSTADHVVTWMDEGSRRVRGRQFLSNGLPRTDEFTLDAGLTNLLDRGPRVAGLSDSGYGISWSRPRTLISRTSVFRRFVGAVVPLGGLETVSLAAAADEFEPDLALLEGGAMAAVWTGEDGAGSNGIGLRVYRPDRTATGPGEFANSQITGNQSGAAVSPIYDGRGFVVAWTSDRLAEPGTEIAFRLFRLPEGGL